MSTPKDAVFGLATGSADQLEYNTAQLQILAALSKVQTLSIVQIQSCSDSVVVVKVIVNLLTGNGQSVQHGEIYGLPFVRAQGGTSGILLDPVAGDLGLCGFCSRDISSVKAAKGQANPASARTFDWADGVYIGGLGLLNMTPTQYLQFIAENGGIKLVSPTAGITLDSPLVNLTGDLVVDGDATTGSLTMTGTFTANGDGTFTGTFTGTSAVFSGSVTAASFAGSGGGPGSGSVTSVEISAADSLSATGGPITTAGTITVALAGDVATPGNDYYYGSNGTGAKGWYPLTAGGTVTSVAIAAGSSAVAVSGGPITGAGTLTVDLSTASKTLLALAATAIQPAEVTNSITWTGSALELLNDTSSPGASFYYGTNAGNVKGWYVLPSGGASWSITDGVNTVTGVTALTVVGGTVAGALGVATLTISGGGGATPFNVTPDTHPATPTGVGLGPNDEFETGTALDTAGTRYSGATAWTIYNAVSVTNAVTRGALVFSGFTGSINNDLVAGQPLTGITAPYDFQIKRLQGYYPPSDAVFYGMFIGFAATGQGYYFGEYNGTLYLISQSTFGGSGAGVVTNVGVFMPAALYLDIVCDGTNIIFTFSYDGVVWNPLGSVAISAFLGSAPDTIGVFTGQYTGGTAGGASFDWFRRMS